MNEIGINTVRISLMYLELLSIVWVIYFTGYLVED